MNLIGIDFEEWFHPELIKKRLPNTVHENTIVNGLDCILDWLRKRDTFATFFIVGEILKSNNSIIDKIIENGHEIGFHSMYHERLDNNNTKENFETELKQFEKILGRKPRGFRAPSFSINHNSSWVLDLLSKYDYWYDSSIVPVKTRLYGVIGSCKNPYHISSKNILSDSKDSKLLEFPLLTTKFFGKEIMAGGGFYLRTFPLKIIKNEISSRNRNGYPATMYIHSWELTPKLMPKIKLPFIDNFVTYHNLDKAFSKMDEIIKNFEFSSFEKYIKKNYN